MKIITEGLPDNDSILLDSIQMTYYQDNDCVECSDIGQHITIETRDGGGGKFYHIKTDGWSFDSIEQITDLINDFIKRTK